MWIAACIRFSSSLIGWVSRREINFVAFKGIILGEIKNLSGTNELTGKVWADYNFKSQR